MLTSPDPLVAQVASGSLQRHVKTWSRSKITSAHDLANFLSGRPVGGRSTRIPGTKLPTDLWARVRMASRRLKVEWNSLLDKPSLVMGASFVTPDDRRSVVRILHQRACSGWKERWQSHVCQGKTVSAHSLHSHSNDFITNSASMLPHSQIFAFKARLNLLPVRTVRARIYARNNNTSPPLRCRRCRDSVESLAHVLNHCPASMSAITSRHDSVMSEVLRRIPPGTFSSVTVDRVVPEHVAATGELLRPDIVARRPDGSAVVVDVVCPFDRGADALDEAAARKLAKYDELCTNLHQATGKPVACHALVVGSLGSYARGNNTTLSALGIPNGDRSRVAKLISSLSIKGSHNIWRSWCSGVSANELRE